MSDSNKTALVKNKSALVGAAFLMATSAIGPAFLTQTALFTEQFGASFGFVILTSIILAIIVQLNVWRVIGVSGLRGQEVANKVLPGLGYFVSFLVVLGGFAFNIANVGGAALGFNVMFGMKESLGAIIAGILAITIFISKDAGSLVDKAVKILGGVMIAIIAYVAFTSNPPVASAVKNTFVPETGINPLIFPIITILGGTVGGYITFSGGHRLLDAGISGEENLKQITKSSIMGISIAGLVRVLLFLAVLGVVTAGATLDPSNPAASAFEYGAGPIGYRFFGVVLWAAATTSIIGCAYTSISFLKTFSKFIATHERGFIIAFIAITTLIMASIGKPVDLMIIAGAINGLILPITCGVMLLACRRKDIVGENYKHPTWLIVTGVIAVIIAAYAGITSLPTILSIFGN